MNASVLLQRLSESSTNMSSQAIPSSQRAFILPCPGGELAFIGHHPVVQPSKLEPGQYLVKLTHSDFNAILSSAAVTVMLSYLQPIIIRVFWPLSLKERGPFTLGSWSWSINFLSFLFTVFVCVLFILPTVRPTNAQNMNYAIVAIGGLLVITTSMWVFWGRSRFIGPVKTVPVPPNAQNVEMEQRTGDEKSVETKKQ
ncbi:hypothetical protein ACEPAH_4126 [Sanghuangporus vaninii]